jgi:tRNA threonylcarbamoyladenosine biosynthesis protein TsaE
VQDGCVFLEGDLGAGKTTLVRGLLRAWGVTGAVRSPTYTLIEPYEVTTAAGPRRVFHLDLYRLGDPEELEYLGWREFLAEDCLLLIEWSERGDRLLPSPALLVDIKLQPPGRLLRFQGHGIWERPVATMSQAVAGDAAEGVSQDFIPIRENPGNYKKN